MRMRKTVLWFNLNKIRICPTWRRATPFIQSAFLRFLVPANHVVTSECFINEAKYNLWVASVMIYVLHPTTFLQFGVYNNNNVLVYRSTRNDYDCVTFVSIRKSSVMYEFRKRLTTCFFFFFHHEKEKRKSIISIEINI